MLAADDTGGAQMPKSNTSPPKRRKKLVTKMYVDDEGAMGELFLLFTIKSEHVG